MVSVPEVKTREADMMVREEVGDVDQTSHAITTMHITESQARREEDVRRAYHIQIEAGLRVRRGFNNLYHLFSDYTASSQNDRRWRRCSHNCSLYMACI